MNERTASKCIKATHGERVECSGCSCLTARASDAAVSRARTKKPYGGGWRGCIGGGGIADDEERVEPDNSPLFVCSGVKEFTRLPAPNGPIYVVMRLYWPKTTPPSILPPESGTWNPPGVVPAK